MRKPLPSPEKIRQLPADGGKEFNRLINTKSPYLLQHARNPVDWYPWGDEAFARAKREDRPIFLSIGYSTCHWCHVMEHESFEDIEVAKLLNRYFVCIKVDREERPDIDGIYMTVCQMLTKGGGWPLTIVMTPEKRPFFAGTYFPKQSVPGRIGMIELIPKIGEIWKSRREDINRSAQEIMSALKETSEETVKAKLRPELLSAAFKSLKSGFDSEYGGFGRAPKFPTPHSLLFLLRHWRRTGQGVDMVEKTLLSMRQGGIHDHLGGGYHRYATDREWLVPHFEKMLYDQAQIALAAIECYQATGRKEFSEMAREIFAYVLRDMTAPEGGFYSAEDADSEGVEGKFYVWRQDEIDLLLSKDEARAFSLHYSLTQEGNYRDEATRAVTGNNIPHLTAPLADTAKKLKVSEKRLSQLLQSARQKLFAAREKRVRPLRDDKVLTDWNGLMIAALSRAGWALNDSGYIQAAEAAAGFLLKQSLDNKGHLLHRWRKGEAGICAYLDDYAFLAWGMLELYGATFKPAYLEQAASLTGKMIKYHWDEKNGGFFFTAAEAADNLIRQKKYYDGAVPAGNSVALLLLLRLERITGREEYGAKARILAEILAAQAERHPPGYTQFLAAADLALAEPMEIVIAGELQADDTKAMLGELRREYLPNALILLKSTKDGVPGKLAPFMENYESLDGKAAAYVCRNRACKLPTTDVAEMLRSLKPE